MPLSQPLPATRKTPVDSVIGCSSVPRHRCGRSSSATCQSLPVDCESAHESRNVTNLVGLAVTCVRIALQVALDEPCVQTTPLEVHRLHDAQMERDVTLDAHDTIFLQCASHSEDSVCTAGCPNDQLGNHRIVID